MATRRDFITVCHVSPLGNTKGGISTVVKSYEVARDWSVRCLFVESHCDGTRAEKVARMIRALLRAVGLCLFRKVDIVQVHVGDFPSIYRKMLVTIPFFLRPGCRRILHVHGAAFLAEYLRQGNFGRWLVRRFIHRFDLVIALSDQWRADLQRYFEISEIAVLANAVEVPEMAPPRNLAGARRFVFLGLIGARKGVFDLVEATSTLVARGVDLTLRIGGNGEVDRLRETLNARDLNGTVDYIGWVTGAARDEVMRNSHVLVLPSYAEGAPMSLIEGMAAGLPVISTKVGAIPEMIEDGVSGFLIDPGDVPALVTAMQALCENDDMWLKMSQRAHANAQERFSLTMHKRRLLALYEGLLGRE